MAMEDLSMESKANLTRVEGANLTAVLASLLDMMARDQVNYLQFTTRTLALSGVTNNYTHWLRPKVVRGM